MIDLTVLIITKNEEKNILKCLNSLNGIAKKIIIVDSFSQDNTKAIVEKEKQRLNIEFFEHKFVTHSKQINWALENIKIDTAWIMRLDADEELTFELATEISERLPNLDNSISGVILKRRVYFLDRWIKHGGVYPVKLLRIFRKNQAYSEIKEMDEHMIVKRGKVIEFEFDFLDRNRSSLYDWIGKHNWYSEKELNDYSKNMYDDMGRTQKNVYYKLPIFFRAHLYFIYRYYIKLGFLDGKEGKIFHYLQAYWYRFLVDAKIFEKESEEERKSENTSK
ncbi:glycosyltransferase family 2 protein [Enterococcus asini]|uniref:glycosyltransferase family 2 protein n=1 Tax=Enterococcus asini TaxID=57732 RepID=UPI0028901B0A|nr:glycosyltransferase family 2 protein [Enterococcus asini]MDT2764688.1 glycosyltransferase family 2 protein [Enterococcus asini]